MQSYLIVGTDENSLKKEIESLRKKLQLEVLEFSVKKIEDIRNLQDITKLKFSKKTAILIKNIEEATTEALNAFLKNLEEPQENLYYILTTSSTKKVLPTIVSRCQIITINNSQLTINNENTKKFLKMSIGEKLAYVDRIKEREEAIRFVEDFIYGCHKVLHETKDGHVLVANYLNAGTQTLNNLKANGNVTLQLANFVIGLV